MPDLPLILWRLVPTVLFLGGAVPLVVRALRGVIPGNPSDGISPTPITRRDSPGRFRRWTFFYLLLAAALTAWFLLAWLTRPFGGPDRG